VLEGFPALGQKREATLSPAARRAQQRVAGAVVNAGFFYPGRLPHRDVDTVTCAFVARIGQHGHDVQERAQHREDILAGRGQVMDITRKHIRNPHRHSRRVKQSLDVPPEIMRLPRVLACAASPRRHGDGHDSRRSDGRLTRHRGLPGFRRHRGASEDASQRCRGDTLAWQPREAPPVRSGRHLAP